MNRVEARDHANEELNDRLRELKEELFNLRFQLATGQLDNHRRVRQVRREIAMIRTILRERELEEGDLAGASVEGGGEEGE